MAVVVAVYAEFCVVFPERRHGFPARCLAACGMGVEARRFRPGSALDAGAARGRGAAARGRVRGVSWRLSFFLRPLCRGLSSPVSGRSVACRGLQRSPSGGEPVPLFPVVLEVAIVLMTNRLLDSV